MSNQEAKKYNFKVGPEGKGERLDVFLKDGLDEISRSSIKQLIENGNVSVNSQSVKSAHHKVRLDDSVEIEVPPKKEFTISGEDIGLEILYEDKDLIIINKPSGMVTHPGKGNLSGTLVNALLNHTKELSTINSPERPGIVHRLDKETSGVMVIAKNNHTHMALAKQFEDHSIKRIYVALVQGKVEFEEGEIDLPLSRSIKDRKKIAVRFIDGRSAKTYYRVLKRYNNKTLLELKPFTGRTHQLRVHLAHIGHPILGDEKYGKKSSFFRLALHAKTLGFIHPGTNKSIEFSKEPPEDFFQ